jgi:hypothetical protein
MTPSPPVGLGNTIRVSCGQLRDNVILMGEPAKDLLPADPVLGEVDRFGRTGADLGWRELAKVSEPGSYVPNGFYGPGPT